MSDAAIASIVTGMVTMVTIVAGVATLWLKLKYESEKGQKKTDEVGEKADAIHEKAETVEKKLDGNTAATVVGARKAGEAATVAVATMEAIDKKLNGGVDSAIEAATKPIREALQDHVMQYESDMKEIRQSITDNTAALNDIYKRLK